MLTSTHLRLGALRGPIDLHRTPRFLRFVLVGSDWSTLDALDQPNDLPRAGETIILAELVYKANVRWMGSKGGRRTHGAMPTATYAPLPKDECPPDDVLRDTAKWQAWAKARHMANPVQGKK